MEMEMVKEERQSSGVEGSSTTTTGNQHKKRGRPRKGNNVDNKKNRVLDMIEESEVESPPSQMNSTKAEVTGSNLMLLKRSTRSRRKSIPRRAAM